MYYYYDKDYYGREHCYEIDDDELRKDKENTLEQLVTDEFPIWHLESWDDLDWDPDNEYDRWLAKTITDFLSTGRTLPVIVITHFTSKPDERYECCNTEDEIDYDDLIHEYAGPKAYRKDPEYIKEGEYTAETAEKCGMYALAKLLREKESEVEEKENNRKEEFIQALKAIDVTDPPERVYHKVYDLAYKYQQDTKTWNLSIAFEEFISDEEAQILMKSKSDNFNDVWWLVSSIEHREDVYRLTVYGELLNLDRKDIELLIAEIIERLED